MHIDTYVSAGCYVEMETAACFQEQAQFSALSLDVRLLLGSRRAYALDAGPRL